MILSDISVKRPVFASVISLLLVVFGSSPEAGSLSDSRCVNTVLFYNSVLDAVATSIIFNIHATDETDFSAASQRPDE